MRILIHGINFFPEPAGVGKYTGEMASWLSSRGHEVRIVTAPPHYPQWRVSPEYRAWNYRRERHPVRAALERMPGNSLSSPAEMEVFRCPIWVPGTPCGVSRLLHLASFGLSSWPAMLWQVAWRPNVVLLVEPTLFCSLQTLLVAFCSGAKTWLHVQDLEVDAAFELGDLSSSRWRDWAFAIERRLLSRIDQVSTISDRMVDRLISKGVDSSRCALFPNWVDTTVIHPLPSPSPLRRELGIAEHTIVALYSGSMGKKQGLDLLVDAARRLTSCADVRFIFCGEGSYRHTFVEKVKDLPNVSLLPFQPTERLNDLLNLADIHLLPQRADAADLVMPSKLTGMLASGRAVVATAHTGTQLSAVLEGRGIVTPPGEVNAFVSAVLRLAVDCDLRKRMGEEARKYAIRHLERDEILRRFELSLLKICGHSPLAISTGLSKSRNDKLRVTEDLSTAARQSK
jgi:colanic acid biosynthesis glycosyl transferase WcaI